MYQLNTPKRICKICDQNCFLCETDSKCYPHACNVGYVYQNHQCIKIQSKKCVSNCLKCINDTTCGECASSFFLYKGKCTSCTQKDCRKIWWDFMICEGLNCEKTCQAKQYIDQSENCQNCDVNCEECVGSTSNDCTKCFLGKIRFNYTCVTSCPNGTVHNIASNNCDLCFNKNCDQCSGIGNNQCTQCKNTFSLLNGDCTCASNQYLNSITNQCLNCSSKCISCFGPNEDQCLTCKSDEVLLNSKCYKKCPSKQFLNIYTFQCENCHEFGEECTGPLEKDITKCLNNLVIQYQKCSCPLSKFYDPATKSCLDCHSSCQSCSGTNSNQCLSCSSGKFFKENTCVSVCPEKYYTNTTNSTCLECYQTCQTCSGPNINQCLSCSSNNTVKANGECPIGPELCTSSQYYDSVNKLCINCSPQCGRCSGSSSLQCLGCKRGSFLRGTQCISIEGNTNMCYGRVCDSKYCQDCSSCDYDTYCVNLCTKDNCKIEENCKCPSVDIPGNLTLNDTPQFVMFTIDDGLSNYEWSSMKLKTKFLDDPNLKDDLNCNMKFTYYITSDDIENYKFVPFVNRIGEIALHTSTHNTSSAMTYGNWIGELNNCRVQVKKLSGLNDQLKFKGARAPYLNFNNDWFKVLSNMSISYDSSTMYITIQKNGKQHRIWPHTLDFGTVYENGCGTVACKTQGHQNIWEFPMQVMVDDNNNYKIIMDPDISTDQKYNEILALYKANFDKNYKASRVPFAVYVHPYWFSYARSHELIKELYTWINTNYTNIVYATESEVIAWIKSPKKFSQISQMNEFNCRNQTENYCSSTILCSDKKWSQKEFCLNQCENYFGVNRCWDQICDSAVENASNCPLDCAIKNKFKQSDQINVSEAQNRQKLRKESNVGQYQYIIIVSIICATVIVVYAMRILSNKKKQTMKRAFTSIQERQTEVDLGVSEKMNTISNLDQSIKHKEMHNI